MREHKAKAATGSRGWARIECRALCVSASRPAPVLCLISSCFSFCAQAIRNMIRSYKGITPTIPATCYVDDSAQIIGDVVLAEHGMVWMKVLLRGDVIPVRV